MILFPRSHCATDCLSLQSVFKFSQFTVCALNTGPTESVLLWLLAAAGTNSTFRDRPVLSAFRSIHLRASLQLRTPAALFHLIAVRPVIGSHVRFDRFPPTAALAVHGDAPAIGVGPELCTAQPERPATCGTYTDVLCVRNEEHQASRNLSANRWTLPERPFEPIARPIETRPNVTDT